MAHTQTRFFVDTGSEVSVIPSTSLKRSPEKLTLAAVNATPISMYGKQSLTLIILDSDDPSPGYSS